MKYLLDTSVDIGIDRQPAQPEMSSNSSTYSTRKIFDEAQLPWGKLQGIKNSPTQPENKACKNGFIKTYLSDSTGRIILLDANVMIRWGNSLQRWKALGLNFLPLMG